MAKYVIKHCCGHETETQIYGRNVEGERERKAAWLASRLCPDCWAEQQAKERAEASAKAAEQAADAGLPALTGSPKQIAWAETIRGKAMDTLLAEGLKPGAAEALVALNTSAAWWIDRRQFVSQSGIGEVLRGLRDWNPEGFQALEEKFN